MGSLLRHPNQRPPNHFGVVLARVELDARADASDLDPRPLAAGNKQPARRGPTDHHRRPAATQLEEEIRHLRRQLRRYEEELGQLQRRMSRLKRSWDEDQQ